MTFTKEVVDHLKRHRGLLLPIVRQCLKVGFDCRLVLDGRETDMTPYALSPDFTPIYDLAAAHALPAEGSLVIRLNGRTLTSATYDEKGHSEIELVFLKGSAREFFRQMPKLIAQIRRILVENFTNQTIFDLIDFGADFLARTRHPFSYTIRTFDRPTFQGRLEKKTFKTSILDPAAYLRLGLFMLKGADAMALSFRNPFDILALLDTAQASIKYIACAYEERGLTGEVSAMGQKLLSCGSGVKSNLMTDRFGPTSVHLEAIFKMFSSAVAGGKEADA